IVKLYISLLLHRFKKYIQIIIIIDFLIILIIVCHVLILFFLKILRRGINLDSTKQKKTKCVTSCAYCPPWEA
ncbi:hypothetical protein SEEN185_02246, partial [Salmonella enterica subsp. enterica serovar Newport str. CVM 35185]